MKALVRCLRDTKTMPSTRLQEQVLTISTEGGQGGKEGDGIVGKKVGVLIDSWIWLDSFADSRLVDDQCMSATLHNTTLFLFVEML